jgi:hypothetical protein
MDEGRKRVLLIAASILAARKLAQYAGKRIAATVAAISDAVRWAEAILREIDSRWPAGKWWTAGSGAPLVSR